MDGRGNLFFREYYTGTTSEKTFPKSFIPKFKEQENIGSEQEESESLYAIPFEEVDQFRRHTRSYVNKLSGLKFILPLPRRKSSRKIASYTKDSIIVENLEELVDLSIQEIVQPLDQLGPESHAASVFSQYPPQYPP